MHQIIVGVDPGIVHTGLVVLEFDTEALTYRRQFAVVDGLDAAKAEAEIRTMLPTSRLDVTEIFIEKYRPRSGFSVDQRMMQANAEFKSELGGRLLQNTGVMQVVGKPLLQLLHVWNFGQSTHHQDLRSAARIAVLGMLLDPLLNQTLFIYVTDNLEGRQWDVRTD